MIEKKFVDLRITALSDEDLNDVLILLRKIVYCGEIGGNRTIPVVVDGDGSGQISVEVHKDFVQHEDLKNIKDIVNLDLSKLKSVDDGQDFETHYIGE